MDSANHAALELTGEPCLPTDRPPRVAIVSLSGAIAAVLGRSEAAHAMGGAELQMARFGEMMRDRGWDVRFLVSCGAGASEDFDYDGFRFITCYTHWQDVREHGPLLMRLPGLRFWLHNTPLFWRAMARADADVYLIRAAHRVVGVAALFCRRHGRALVFSAAHNRDVTDDLSRGMLYRYGVRHADAVVVQHKGQQDALKQNTGREACVLPNVVPFAPQPVVRRETGNVLWVGSIRPRKRPMLALDVAKALPDVPFKVISWTRSDVATEVLSPFETRAGAMGNVELLGYVQHQDLPQHYSRARILLHTSAPGEEGFPNVFLEAWAHGVPVVAAFDPDGIIGKHGLGIVVQDAAGMIGAVRHLLEDEDERLRLARNAHDYLMAHHSSQAVGNQLESVLCQARNHRTGQGAAT